MQMSTDPQRESCHGDMKPNQAEPALKESVLSEKTYHKLDKWRRGNKFGSLEEVDEFQLGV